MKIRLSKDKKENGESLSALLKGLRTRQGLTIEQVANRMGSASKNAYAQYENGGREPGLTKLTQILAAIDPQVRLYLCVEKG